MDQLSRRYRVLALDLPGHGRTLAPPTGFSPRTFTDAIEETLQSAKIKKAVLVGHSMGGVIIRQYARIHPDRVVALIFLDAPFRFPDTPEMRAWPSSFGGADGMANRRKFIESMFVPATTPPMRDQILKLMLQAPESVAVGAAAWMVDELTKPLDKIEAPSLVLVKGTAKAPAMEHFGKVPEFAAVEGTGHFLMMEKPKDVNDYILPFLSKLR